MVEAAGLTVDDFGDYMVVSLEELAKKVEANGVPMIASLRGSYGKCCSREPHPIVDGKVHIADNEALKKRQWKASKIS